MDITEWVTNVFLNYCFPFPSDGLYSTSPHVIWLGLGRVKGERQKVML